MASITQILEVELHNKDRIHLFREGLFLKAYQHSAFQFITHVKQFRVIKKHFKSVGAEIAMLGFPSDNLSELFPEDKINYLDGNMHVSVECPAIDLDAFTNWFDTVEMQPQKEKKENRPKQLAHEHIALPRGETLISPVNHYGVLRKLQEFSLESATPLDCMLFLRDLKMELKNNGGI